MKNILAIIPARFNSSRFPGKPLVKIRGKTLIEWTYTNASKFELFQRVIVATDDRRIFDAVKAFGGEVCLTSGNYPSGTDRIAEVASGLRIPPNGIIINVQGDEPLIRVETLRSLAAPMLRDESIPMATLCYRIRNPEEIENPNVVKVVKDKTDNALYFSRSPIPYDKEINRGYFFKHIGVYAFRKDFLLKFSRMEQTGLEKREKLEQLRALENGCRIKIVESDFDPVEVDVPEDIETVLGELNKERKLKNASSINVPDSP